MSRRNVFFILLCVGAALGCTRLGVWQLGRLGERRQRNELLRARLDLPVVALAALAGDTAGHRFRRVYVRGTYDYAREFALTGRSRNGSPGVNLVTPLRVAGRDTVVLVNRGWVYSPDAATVDLRRWRERDTATVSGYVEQFAPQPGRAASENHDGAYRYLDRALLTRELGAPLAPLLVVAQGDTAGTAANRTPVRLELPPLDEGSHWNYAVQWFAFAGIALGGLVTFLTSERRRRTGR